MSKATSPISRPSGRSDGPRSALNLVWLRRDLRLQDNHALYQAYEAAQAEADVWVQPLFIFDPEILGSLPEEDARVSFIDQTLAALKAELLQHGSDLWVRFGKPEQILSELVAKHSVGAIYVNHDYEPAAIARDTQVERWALKNDVSFFSFKDQVIFERDEVLTDAGKPYTVFTPYKRKWLKQLRAQNFESFPLIQFAKFRRVDPDVRNEALPTLQSMGFIKNSQIEFPSAKLDLAQVKDYAQTRDFPGLDATTRMGLHLRFGTVSVRALVTKAKTLSEVWLSELIWREFFMQILFHFPHVVKASFRPAYDKIEWRTSARDLKLWQQGRTGYPLVDAGMRELNATGFMHNRVRMVVASFLTKHLLIHWLEGERYFALKLLDYELSSNNGNWQWVAGTGCDAAPYFRVFNPDIQLKKFDKDLEYVKKWVPDFGTKEYPQPMISHPEGRDRALRAYLKALKPKT